MQEEKVNTTRLTFDFFKVTAEGVAAKLVHRETVELFGVERSECFCVNEEGEKDLRESVAEAVYPLIKLDKWAKRSTYHTIQAENLPRSEDWFERERFAVGDEEADEEE